ncbi:MAG: HYR domain-containing protein [Saprospiraceae bacterium]
MRPVFLFALALALASALSAQPSSTFFATFDAERGSVIAPAAGGNLWLGGQKDERVLLVKLNAEGKILDKHTIGFEGAGFDLEHLTDLFEDSDGTLVGCGSFEGDNLGRNFVFRYNPVAQQIVWEHTVRSGTLTYLHGITQLGPGGDYVLYGQTSSAGNRDAELLLLNRNTGLIVPGKAGRIDLGLSDRFSQVVYHDGTLYAAGHMTVGAGFGGYGRTRHAICKLDTATFQPVWSRVGPIPTNVLANLQGRDLIVDDNALISTCSGNTSDPDLSLTTIFLQKNDLAGNLIWAKQYDLPQWTSEFAEEVISLPDGYLLYGHELIGDTSRLFLLKTDKNGNAQWARKINYDTNDEFPDVPARSKILRLGDALFLTALSQNANGQTQGIFLKTDLNGAVTDSCSYLQNVTVFPVQMLPPVSEAVVPTFTASTAILTAATISKTTPDLTLSKKCGATGTCPDLPDLRATLDSIVCTDGDPKLYFTVCNIGGQPYDGPYFFYVYDKNPLTDTAKLLTGIIASGDQPILPGDCFGGLPLTSDLIAGMPFELDTFTKLYSLIGTTFSVQPPIPISGFPYPPNLPECNYLNNLDSISIPPNLCGDCKTPVTFVKKLGTPQRRELAFSMCASADGNVYVAGKQGDNPMIAKISTRGEQIWVRNFPPINPNEPIEWASIIEDSDGKIVVCGTEGASPSNRRAIAMRYDPVAGAVLWYKRYQSDKPVGVAIVEKSPGGDFVLQVNYQTVGSGGVSAQAQFFTLKRADGNTTGSSVGYQSIGNDITLANTVLNNGKLYAVGSWGIKATDEVRPFFARISPNTFLPDWAYLQVPDMSSNAARWMPPADVAFDGDIAVIVGSGYFNPLTPTENIFVYLQKHNPDGSLVWRKRYDMEMVPEEVLTVPNAYFVFGRMVGTNRFGMLKTDVNGKVLRAAVLDAAPPSPNSVGFANRQGLLLSLPQQLLMLDHTWENDESDLVLLRTDMNFGLDDDCDLLQTVQVGSSTLAATTEPALFSIGTNTPASAAQPANAVFQTDSLPLRKLCPRCPCEGQPDVSFRVTAIQCAADSTHVFKTKTCNTGDAATTTPVEVVFYDKNPLTEAATALWSITVTQPVGPGGCAETTESLPVVAAQFGKIYTFAGVPAGTPTPINLNLLAADSGFPECHWENNLDSFTLHAPVCDGCENPTTFFKTMGRVDQAELGYSLCTAADGTVYMAGRQGKKPMLAKMTPNGEMLWVRNFPAGGGPFNETVELVEIIEDSEGKLVLCGTEGLSPNTRMAVAMRYDPVADEVLWFKRYPEQNPQALGIFEKTPGGNFVTYAFSDELFPGGPPFGSYYKARSEVWEINRATGEVVPPLLTYFGGTPSVYFQDMVPHNGSLYVAGSWQNPDVPNSGRPILAKLSAIDAAPEWIFGVLPDTTIPFQLIGFHNILADNDHLLVMGLGATGLNTPAQKNYTFLSKYTLDGTLLWMKSYDATIATEDILALPEGYVIFGRSQGNSWVLFKTDKDGNVLKAQQLTLPTAPGTTFRYFRQNQLLRLPNHLLVVDDFKDGAFEDIVLFKTDLDLNFDAACGLAQPLQINTTVLSPKKNEIFTTFETYQMAAANAETTFQADSLSSTQLCPQCPCTDKPDLTCQVETITCLGTDGYVANLRICNTGFVNAPAGFNLTFYDKNPLAGAAVPLFSASVPLQPGFGDCAEYALPLGFDPKGYAQIFTLAGVWSDVQTPVVLEDFPHPNGFAECDYANNLDSIIIGPNLCPGDPCKPETFIKLVGEPGKIENHSALCAAPDGSLYLAGLKGARTAISKMTADGKFLWTRSFVTEPYEPVIVAEIVVDSEGMIVGSGRKGDKPQGKGFAFRYDPVANKMLWAQEFAGNFPVVEGGILEKTPGGNYLLYQNAFVDSLRKRPEILELDRATGQIVPGFAKRYNLVNFDQAFTSVVARNGALYVTGYTIGLFGARRALVVILDANTGEVYYGAVSKHSWATPSYFSGADLIVDDTSFLILYHGSETSYSISDGSGTPVPLFLQKHRLDGDEIWTRKYMVSTPPKELVAVPDGYVILGGRTNRFLLKTDKAGYLIGAKQLANPPAFSNNNGEQQNQMVLAGSHLFVADVALTNGADQYTTLLKTDLNLGLDFDCSQYALVQVADSNSTDVVSNYPLSAIPSPATQQAVVISLAADAVTVRETCPFCPDLPCDSIAVQQTLEFYPGDTVFLAGTPYTQPDTVTLTLTTDDGCDSVVTYVLRRVITNVDWACPANMTVTIPASQSSAPVTYPLPAAATDCPVPAIDLTRLQGPPPGGAFPVGTTLVCYQAANHCGIRDTCCFTVTVLKAAEETACDVKTPAGSCIKYEILSVRLDSLGRPRYRFRLTNTCASPLRFVYFQLPNSMTAKAPLEGATYTAPSGNTYLVRNPNAAPFHSVRFKPLSGNLSNGQSDIFEYTLPKQAQPAFILVSVKLADGSTYDAHLNTFSCPVQPYVAVSPPTPLQRRGEEHQAASQKNDNQTNRNTSTTPPLSSGEGSGVRLRPNPTSGLLFVDLPGSLAADQPVLISVLNAQGQLVLEGRFIAENSRIVLRLPERLANGLYYLTAQPVTGGMRSAARFVLER